jgi:hypothetical protein
MKAILGTALLLALAPSLHAALPGDTGEGKRLHDLNCLGCHDTAVYTRPKRTVQSIAALQRQLDGCGHMTPQRLSAADAQNIIKYLNESFYRFP